MVGEWNAMALQATDVQFHRIPLYSPIASVCTASFGLYSIRLGKRRGLSYSMPNRDHSRSFKPGAGRYEKGTNATKTRAKPSLLSRFGFCVNLMRPHFRQLTVNDELGLCGCQS